MIKTKPKQFSKNNLQNQFLLYSGWTVVFPSLPLSSLSFSSTSLSSQVSAFSLISIKTQLIQFHPCTSLISCSDLLFNRGRFDDVQDSKQVPAHDMARNTNRRRQASAQSHRLRSQERKIQNPPGARVLVGSGLGPDPLLHRSLR